MKCKILSVKIVPGYTIDSSLKAEMQEVETDKAVLIEALPIYGGRDWQKEVGKTLDLNLNFEPIDYPFFSQQDWYDSINEKYEQKEQTKHLSKEFICYGDPAIEFYPSDERVFKEKLLESKMALRTWFYKDGTIKKEIWKANRLSSTSNLRGNIQSTNRWRRKEIDGLIKVRLELLY